MKSLKQQKIAIFGGSFNPVHNEHVKLATAVKAEFRFDKIIVIPTGTPPHKRLEIAAEHRLNMTKLAFGGLEGFEVSPLEIFSQTYNYTIDTLNALKKDYDDITMLIGGDSLFELETWREFEKVLKLAAVCVAQRYETKIDEKIEYLEDRYGARIIKSRFIGKNVSSTKLKVFLELGLDVSEFIPLNVAEYIRQNGLYRDYAFYVDKLKGMISEKRLRHTAFTIICALELNKALGLKIDENEIFLSALLHDCQKELKLKNGFEHAERGAQTARDVFKIKDERVLNAIRYHSTARPAMTDLEELIFISDIIEETREFEGVGAIREETFKNIKRGIALALEDLLGILRNEKIEINVLTIEALEYYKKMNNE
jgi:nicotinate-nucleotide adenylyltransferase